MPTTPRLHIFNPDTDYALANGSKRYTPPSHVVKLRRELSLLPALYASRGDAILLLDNPQTALCELPHHDAARQRGLTLITRDELPKMAPRLREFAPEPWGWNASIRQFLSERIGNMPGLPDEDAVARIRALSHRRLTVAFLREMADMLSPEIELPRELTDPDEAVEAFRKDCHLFFKSPWSSSGRGIMLADDQEERHVRPWVSGVIARQGSVMMEKAYKRRLDFATEWWCADGKARFLGLSLFRVSRRGKYHGNETGTQEYLRSRITANINCNLDAIVDRQREAIDKLIAREYDGPLGIDMLATESGAVNPCVEINLRHTMGMVELLDKLHNEKED